MPGGKHREIVRSQRMLRRCERAMVMHWMRCVFERISRPLNRPEPPSRGYNIIVTDEFIPANIRSIYARQTRANESASFDDCMLRQSRVDRPCNKCDTVYGPGAMCQCPFNARPRNLALASRVLNVVLPPIEVKRSTRMSECG